MRAVSSFGMILVIMHKRYVEVILLAELERLRSWVKVADLLENVKEACRECAWMMLDDEDETRSWLIGYLQSSSPITTTGRNRITH
jgi:hypothetical protein